MGRVCNGPSLQCPVTESKHGNQTGSCIRRDRAGKDGTKRRDQILWAQETASDMK